MPPDRPPMSARGLARVRAVARRWLAKGSPADQLTLAAAVPVLLAQVAYLERRLAIEGGRETTP
jgi:hypothetical protein